ncbi:unnamed protein product [Larinioides sclopetarius]|uniref:A-kinase anchor protein 17A n=1 Tax=Larinioides sclopetarius TaxID=280406 RepID=A0AAV1YY54_9ARAC
MPLQTCMDISEAANFEPSLGLFLKPISKIKINVQLPKLSVPGQSISSWHVMEKLKETIRPDTFLYLKSLKITATVIKFEGELETKSSCERALARLRAAGSLKLTSFSERLQIRAAHATSSGPTRHDWESFFRDAKGVNEMKPGERPDTIHVEEVPVCWFTENGKFSNPSEKLLRKAFGTFGKIRRLEIPPKTTSESSMFGKTSSLHNDLLFEAYIQYEEYVEFVIAMESLRGKKLLYKEPDGKVYSADIKASLDTFYGIFQILTKFKVPFQEFIEGILKIKVDFDRTNYLSDRCIKQRAAEAKKSSFVSEDIKNTESHSQLEISQKSKSNILDKNSPTKLEAKIHQLPTIDQEKELIEAQLLLKELLHRAEITERCKEKQLKVSSASLQTKGKMSKSFSEKGSKTLEVLKENDKRQKSHSSKHIKEKHLHSYKDRNKLHKSSDNLSSSEERMSYKDMQKERRPKHRNKHAHNHNKDRKKEKKMDKIKDREKHHQMRLEEKKIKERLNHLQEQEKKNKEKLLLEQERILKEKLIRNLKAREEQKLKVREKLRKKLAGSKVLKSVLANPNISLLKGSV